MFYLCSVPMGMYKCGLCPRTFYENASMDLKWSTVKTVTQNTLKMGSKGMQAGAEEVSKGQPAEEVF
ncbi:hypothetical protein Q3G72_034687 [Acer saccharum]|nr:hypothetical protein Q3G72_034687 [Acer saccharum]